MEPNNIPSTIPTTFNSISRQISVSNGDPPSIPTTFNSLPARRITVAMDASGSVINAPSEGTNPEAMNLVMEMLARYNDLIECNSNAIKANKLAQDTIFGQMQNTLGSIIQVLNSIKQEVSTLEHASRSNAAGLAAIESGLAAGNAMLVHSRLDDIQHRVEANERDIANLKKNAEVCSQTVIGMEGKLGNLDHRVSSIERMLAKQRKQQQNQIVGRAA